MVIAGPTASGKSALALTLAERLDGTVINADSMQVYSDLHVLTARPGAEDEARAPHRLYGFLDAADVCSAGRWRSLAMAEIAAARSVGRRPIVVGGSGLYLKALLDGIGDIPPVPAAIRRQARQRYATRGAAAFHADLAALDPAGAARLHPHDRQRVTRAWEVVMATGEPLETWQRRSEPASTPYRFALVVVMPPRDQLYRRCDARVRDMVADGALSEVSALQARDLSPALPVMRALGVREFASHLSGEIDLGTAIGQAQRATRQYAKRQRTWLRHQIPDSPNGHITSVTIIDAQFSDSLAEIIINKIT